MNRVLSTLCILLLSPVLLFAQEADTVKVKAGLSVTGFYQTGNVETLIFRANSDLAFKTWKGGEFKSINSYVYQEFGKEKADEDILSLNYIYYNQEQRLTPLVLGFFSTNFRREIDLRYLVGAGVNYELWKDEKNLLEFSVTSEYERTEFSEANFNRAEYNDDPTITTIRGTIWINGRYELFDKKMIVSHESFYQPSLEESNNYRWQAELDLQFPIWKFLSFNVNYLQTFESIVIQNQKQGDSFLTFGVSLKNY